VNSNSTRPSSASGRNAPGAPGVPGTANAIPMPAAVKTIGAVTIVRSIRCEARL
jgi:hypothetical protein